MRRPMTALSAALAVMTALLSAKLPAQQPSQPPATGGNAAIAPISLVADPSQSMARARSARTLLRNGRDYIEYGEYERALELLKEAELRQTELSEPEKLVLQKTIREAREGLRSSDSTNQAVVARPRQGSARQAGAISLGAPQQQADPGSLILPDAPVLRASATAEQNSLPPARLEPVAVQPVSQAQVEAALPPLPAAGEPASYELAAQPAAYVAEPAPLALDENGQVLVSQPLLPTAAPPAQRLQVEQAQAPEELPLPPDEVAPVVEEVLPALPSAATPETIAEIEAPQPEPVPSIVEPDRAIVQYQPATIEQPPSLPELPSPPPPILSEPAEVDIAQQAPPALPMAMPPPNMLPADEPPVVAPEELAQAPAEPALPLAEPNPAMAATPLPVAAEEMPAEAAAVAVQQPLFSGAVEEPEPPPTAYQADAPLLGNNPQEDLELPPLPANAITVSDLPASSPPVAEAPALTVGPNSFPFPSHLQRQVEEIARRQEEDRRLAPSLETSLSSEALAELGQSESRIKLPRPPSPTLPQPIRAVPVPENFVPLEPRNFAPNRKIWAAAGTCHGPLYFQDPVLERYGQSVEQTVGPAGRFLSYPLDKPSQSKQRNQLLQPLFSAGLFAAQIAALPYQMVVDPPWESEYDLGYYRPGDRIPPDTYYLPWHGVGPPLHSRDY